MLVWQFRQARAIILFFPDAAEPGNVSNLV
jgi:hypothetical protein